MKTLLDPELFQFLSLTLFPVVILGIGVIILQLLRKSKK